MLKKKLTKRIKKVEVNDAIPAIPPENYKGSVGKWMIELQERGLWDGQNPEWHGDILIPSTIWWEMVEKLES